MTTTTLITAAANRAEAASQAAVAASRAGNLDATCRHYDVARGWATTAYNIADRTADADAEGYIELLLDGRAAEHVSAEEAAWAEWHRADKAARLAEFAVRMATADAVVAEVIAERG